MRHCGLYTLGHTVKIYIVHKNNQMFASGFCFYNMVKQIGSLEYVVQLFEGQQLTTTKKTLNLPEDMGRLLTSHEDPPEIFIRAVEDGNFDENWVGLL